jgi:hypothetical protein
LFTSSASTPAQTVKPEIRVPRAMRHSWGSVNHGVIDAVKKVVAAAGASISESEFRVSKKLPAQLYLRNKPECLQMFEHLGCIDGLEYVSITQRLEGLDDILNVVESRNHDDFHPGAR